MRAVLQRVSYAQVHIGGKETAHIGQGFLVLLGIREGDTRDNADQLAQKIASLRVFEDQDGKMNEGLLETGGEVLVVSNFTLFADCKKGRRPSFNRAMGPAGAQPLYEYFVSAMERALGKPVPTGEFGADMKITLENDGPVTLILDTDEWNQ